MLFNYLVVVILKLAKIQHVEVWNTAMFYFQLKFTLPKSSAVPSYQIWQNQHLSSHWKQINAILWGKKNKNRTNLFCSHFMRFRAIEISIFNPQIKYFYSNVNFQLFKNGHFWKCDVENWVWRKLALWICPILWIRV